MSASVSLIKENPLLPAEDYAAMRRQAIKDIEQLGHEHWTDYNNSDPGITIMEAVCYAITDLAYRTGFEVKDLLAPKEMTEDTWKQVFYTARQILHNGPVTVTDYRKLIIDIEGVRNAWVEPSKEYEVPVFIDYTRIQQKKNDDCCCEGADIKTCYGALGLEPGAAATSKIVEFEGLYNVLVEYEENVLEEDRREEVRQQVVQRLLGHRSLCEDFLSVSAVDYEEVGMGASVVLEEYADPDQVLAQMFFTIYRYFTPSVPFHTIEQMLERKYDIDEIFEGPALRHGFIETTAIEATDLFRDIRLSDLINALADIKGIKAITWLHLPFEGFDNEKDSKAYFNEWIGHLRQQRKVARIQPMQSQVIFCKERDMITYNIPGKNNRRPERMLKLFKDLKTAERKYKLEGVPLDLPVPTGEYMELEDYYPVTDSLPMCYGVSERGGLSADAPKERKIQALQLKGYLLFFEQLLAGHLVQLNHLRQLYTFDETTDHTIYTRALTEIENLQHLLVDHGTDDSNNPKVLIKDFLRVLQQLTESTPQFHQRRNRMLNHLLARFGEDRTEYEAITRWLVPYEVEERLIQDKINMLKNHEYFKISSNRGKGYDYSKPEFWDTRNVSGLERRAGRLLGFHNITRRTLAPENVVVEELMEKDGQRAPVRKTNAKGQPLSVIKILHPENPQQVLITSVDVVEGCCTEILISQLILHAGNRRHFRIHDELNQRARKSAGPLGVFWFELYDGMDLETAVLLGTSERFGKREERDIALRTLRHAIEVINSNEGMHLVEHLLLRPRFDEILDEAGKPVPVSFLDVCLDSCDLNIGVGEAADGPGYRKKIRRIPARLCYDKMPWVLEYFRLNKDTKQYDQSILFSDTSADGETKVPLTFRRYSQLTDYVRRLQEYGAERASYKIVSNLEEQPAKLKYAFVIYGAKEEVLAKSPYMFNRQTAIQKEQNIAVPDDIEKEIEQLMAFFGFEFDWYCEENACDNNEDPYSFRATVVLPCWTERLRDATFRNLVEKTIRTQSPAHAHIRIVWLGMLEMKAFEKVYCAWLEEMAKTEMPAYELVNPLVDKLNNLRPCGECEEEC